MDLSVSPLPEKQKKFLESGSGLLKRNFNKSQYRKDIVEHLDDSIRYFYHILPNSHLLKKEDIYDKINAQTLIEILENSLKQMHKQGYEKSFQYDFRTVELAKTLFEISKEYLEQNPVLKVHNELAEDTKRSLQNISDSYYILSKIALEKQANEKISIRNEKTMRNDLERLKKLKEDLKYKDEKYIALEKEKNELQNEVSNLDHALTQKSNSLSELIKQKNISSAKLLKQKTIKAIKTIEAEMERLKEKQKAIEAEMERLKEQQKENHQRTLEIQDEQRKMFKAINEKEDEIWKELGIKYDHLIPYYSLKNKLDEFEYKKSPHIPKEKQPDGL